MQETQCYILSSSRATGGALKSSAGGVEDEESIIWKRILLLVCMIECMTVVNKPLGCSMRPIIPLLSRFDSKFQLGYRFLFDDIMFELNFIIIFLELLCPCKSFQFHDCFFLLVCSKLI